MTEMRKERRAPASLKVKYKSATVEQFIEHFGTDVSRGGIFIKTKKPLDTGALLKFEFQLADGSAVIHGVGRVAWRRFEQPERPELPAGMGIKFFKLSDHSRAVVERIEARYPGANSRYEQSDEAEFAPPMSTAPAAAESSAHEYPSNGRNRPPSPRPPARTQPPPPANSSIPPALADVPRSPPPRTSVRVGLPKGTLGSYSSEPSARTSVSPFASRSASPVASPLASQSASRTRDTSEFLASAFQAGGAGPEVRAQARAQAERSRRDPESVELARELFGDIGEVTPAVVASSPASPDADPARTLAGGLTAPLPGPGNATSRGPARGGLSQPVAADEVAKNAFPSQPPASAPTRASLKTAAPTPSGRPEAAWSRPAGAFNASVPSVELPRSVQPPSRNARPSLAAKIPSIEQLVDEAGDLAAHSGVNASRAGRSGGATDPPASLDAADGARLVLAMDGVTLRPPRGSSGESDKPARGKGLLIAALATSLVLGGLAAYLFWQKSVANTAGSATTTVQVPAAPGTPVPAADETPPAQAAAAEPPAAEPEPGPPVELTVASTPRAAQVLVDGKPAGVTPLKLSLPSNVAAQLEVRSSGYASMQRSVTPQAGVGTDPFELAPLPYRLVVETTPPGATVSANAVRAVAPAPLELGHLARTITIVAEKEGHQRTTRAVRLEEFQERDGVMQAQISLTLPSAPPARRRPVAREIPPATPPAPSPAAPDDAPPVLQVKPEASDSKPSDAPPEPEPPAPAAKPDPLPEAPAVAPEPAL